MRTLNTRQGFTLIELLVVIGILAVLAAIAIPSVAGLIDRANVSADSTNANEMTNSMERFASEYELYCQDIASGMVNIGNMDATQGRVYNVIGVTDRAGITALEVAPDAVVEEDQIAIYRDTKYPANAKTARLVVENYTKTSSSTFEPKQSDMNYWYSPDCGIVVFAEPEATVEQLNLLVQSGKDAKGNELSANTRWINLTEGADAERDEETAHGLYFDKPYATTMGGVSVEAIFHEDTSAELYINGVLDTQIPAGLIEITKEKVDMSQVSFGVGDISLDGKTISLDSGIILTLIDLENIKNIEYRMPMVGQNVYIVLTDSGMKIYEKGHSEIALNIPNESIVPTAVGFRLENLSNSTININGENMPLSEFETTYTLYDNNNYILMDYYGETMLFALREDACKHITLPVTTGVTCWRNLRDNNGNITDFYEVEFDSAEDLQGYEVVCSFCGDTIDSYINGNYMYIENTYLEPQLYNGSDEFETYPCKDMLDTNVGGFVAIPIDGTKTDGLLSTVKGKPVTAVYIFNHMVMSPNTKYVMGSADMWAPYGTEKDPIFEMTYQGTISQFKTIKYESNGESVFDAWSRYVQYNSPNQVQKYIIHCTNGDIII